MMMVRKVFVSSVFIVGFVVGFLLGLIFFDEPKRSVPNSLVPISSKSMMSAECRKKLPLPPPVHSSYESWLASQGARIVPLDFDDYFYGNRDKSPRSRSLESSWLSKTVHVTCIVMVERIRNLQAATETWLKHCNDFAFFHAKKPQDLRAVNFNKRDDVIVIESVSSWHFLCNIIRHVWNSRRSHLQWILFVSDDMFVIPENLRRMVAHLDWNNPYYFGHALSLWGQPYNFALAGYVLSKGSLGALAQNFTSSDSCKNGGKYWKKEDFFLGKNLEKLCLLPSDTRDEMGRGRFHGYNLNQLLFENKLASIASYWKNSLFPTTQGMNCCSNQSITFQGIESDKIHSYYYLVNHLHVYNNGSHGNKPAPTPYPPEQVWQQFLRDEGFSNVQNISSELYREAWKTKIAEDMMKSYGNKHRKKYFQDHGFWLS